MSWPFKNTKSNGDRSSPATESPFFKPHIQAKLSVNQPNDIYEQEADAVADQVMRMTDSDTAQRSFFKPSLLPIQLKCAHCEEEEKKMQRKETNAEKGHGLETYLGSLNNTGQSLPDDVRRFYEAKMGHDFSDVKVHTDRQADESAKSINAIAYTHKNHIFFKADQYQPATGQRLLAHELTHVVQQCSGNKPLVFRQLATDQTPDIVDVRDGAPNATNCGAPSHCPATFCQPFTSENLARQQRDRMAFVLLAGIAAFVNRRVVPLWSTYLFGGSPPQNLTSQFGADFMGSPTTIQTTNFLVAAIRRNLQSSPPAFPSGVNTVTLGLATLIPSEVAAITTPGDPNEMNFNIPSDIAGNLAGGIGTDQASCRSGAQPSPFNDARIARGTVVVVRDAAGNLTVIPTINYQVRDTIDLCPGDCGTSREQIATVPMSQFEATGISGDVPFTIDFSAITFPFSIPHP